MSTKRQWVWVALIVILHTVGLLGFSIAQFRPVFMTLVPWHLLLMFIILAANHQSIGEKFFGYALLVILAGFAVEFIGIHWHWPFGDYAYHDTLGPKLWGVPLIIGINWLLLTYSIGVVMQQTRLKSMLVRLIVGALLLVVLDMVVEPAAIKLDYWQWANNVIPLSNYASWFGISVLLLWLFETFKFKKQNHVPMAFLLTEFLFFALHYFIN